MKRIKSDKKFLTELVEVFADLKHEIWDSDYSGLVSLQTGCLRRFTQAAINRSDLAVVKQSFDFVDENFDLVSSTMANSLVVSYLGKLDFSGNNEAERLLPARLRDTILQLKDNYESLQKDEMLNKFLNSL